MRREVVVVAVVLVAVAVWVGAAKPSGPVPLTLEELSRLMVDGKRPKPLGTNDGQVIGRIEDVLRGNAITLDGRVVVQVGDTWEAVASVLDVEHWGDMVLIKEKYRVRLFWTERKPSGAKYLYFHPISDEPNRGSVMTLEFTTGDNPGGSVLRSIQFEPMGVIKPDGSPLTLSEE